MPLLSDELEHFNRFSLPEVGALERPLSVLSVLSVLSALSAPSDSLQPDPRGLFEVWVVPIGIEPPDQRRNLFSQLRRNGLSLFEISLASPVGEHPCWVLLRADRLTAVTVGLKGGSRAIFRLVREGDRDQKEIVFTGLGSR